MIPLPPPTHIPSHHSRISTLIHDLMAELLMKLLKETQTLTCLSWERL